MLRGGSQALEIVPYNALENYFDAELVDLLGEIQRVCIHAERRQQFGADRDDFGVHG